jgi:uncharacterized membrane protein (UPF0182 family)
MEPTLEAALARLFGGTTSLDTKQTSTSPGGGQTPGLAPAGGASPAAVPAVAPPAGGIEPLTAEAQRHYTRAIEAQRAGDWAVYGEEIRQLGATLDRMRQAR